MGIENKEDLWKTLGDEEVQQRVGENWVDVKSKDPDNLNKEELAILMGRETANQVKGSKHFKYASKFRVEITASFKFHNNDRTNFEPHEEKYVLSRQKSDKI